LWLHSLKVAQLLRSAACLHTNQSRSYLNHLVFIRYGKLFITVLYRTWYSTDTYALLCLEQHFNLQDSSNTYCQVTITLDWKEIKWHLYIRALQFIASHAGPCLAKERRMYRIFVRKVKPTVQMSEKKANSSANCILHVIKIAPDITA